MSLVEIKAAQEKQHAEYAEFVKRMDTQLTELKEKGHVSAETKKAAEDATAGVEELTKKMVELKKSYDRNRLTDEAKGESISAKTNMFSKYIKTGDENAVEFKQMFFTDDEKNPQWDQKKADLHEKAFRMYMKTGSEIYMTDHRKSMNVINDVAGGFLISPMLGEMIVHTIAEFSPFALEVDEVVITGDSITFPTTNRRVGAARAHELAARNATTAPTFGEVNFKPEDLYAAPEISQRMLDLRPDLEAWLSKLIADEFIITEANEIANGTGVGGARGFLTYASGTAVGQVQQVNSGNATQINDADIIMDLKTTMKPAYLQGAKWYANRATFNVIGQLKDGNGRYLWQPGIEQGQPMSLLGMPTVPSEDITDIAANSLSLALANLKKAYKFVVHPGMRILRDPFTNKPFVQIHTTKRSTGGLAIHEAVKLMKTSTSFFPACRNIAWGDAKFLVL